VLGNRAAIGRDAEGIVSDRDWLDLWWGLNVSFVVLVVLLHLNLHGALSAHYGAAKPHVGSTGFWWQKSLDALVCHIHVVVPRGPKDNSLLWGEFRLGPLRYVSE